MFAYRPTAPKSRRGNARSPRFRPGLELLEGRACPAVTINGPTVLHPGDSFDIVTRLSSADPDENGEGEPLIVTFNGVADPLLQTKYYFQTWRGGSSHARVLTPPDGNGDFQIAAYIQGEDGDETGEVDITVHQSSDLLAPLVDSFNQLGAADNQNATRWAMASTEAGGPAAGAPFVATVAGGPGAGSASFGGTSAAAALAAAFFGAQAAQNWELSAAYQNVLAGTPDANYTAVEQPVTLPLHVQSGDPSLAPQVAAFESLLQSDQTELGLLRALATADNRAGSAADAGDTPSLALQQQAINTFKVQLAGILASEPALLAAAQTTVASLGVSVPDTTSDLLNFESNVGRNGLPTQLVGVLKMTGATDADIAGFANVVSVQDTTAVAGDHVAQLTDPATLGLFQSATSSVRASLPKPFAVGAGAGGGPEVTLDNPDGTARASLAAFDPAAAGGVRVATADFNGDGVPDLVVGTGPGVPTLVRVLDGTDQHELFSVQPFEATFTGGVFVAAGDLNGDGTPDVVVTPDEGGGPRVEVFGGKDGAVLANFFGIDDPNFRGGARAAVGDVNGDGTPDLVVAAGFGGGPRVAVFDGTTVLSGTPARLVGDFFAFPDDATTLRNGVFVAAGDVNGDGSADLIFGGGPGGGPRVLVLSGKDLVQSGSGSPVPLANFFAGDPNSRGGVRVAAGNLDGDNLADLVTGAGEGAGSRVTAYAGQSLPADGQPPELWSADAFPGFTGGVFVG
jgi:hypothetical protein